MENVKYKRVLLKLSGEMLAGSDSHGVDPSTIMEIVKRIKEVTLMGVEVAIVVGGGNFWRGRNGSYMDRVTADSMGMLATIMNGLALQDALNSGGVPAVLETSIAINPIADEYTIRSTIKNLTEGKVVILAGGTGHPYFTTDTTAALRAVEIQADVILFGKSIDGIYSNDPKIDPSAVKYDHLTYLEVLEQDLKIMDSTATAMCRDNKVPILVFGLDDPENIIKVIKGENVGTIVED